MRDSFINSIYKATKSNREVLCLVGDIGAFLLRNYIKDFPANYYNLGAAEANMMGVAAGLAMSGKIPFVYTITPFVVARCFEQIKVDVCYNKANVKIVGIGSGVSYGTMGSTHHSLEDIAIMSALPNMVVMSPADPQETEEAILSAAEYDGPVYIRLTLTSKPLDYKREKFEIGKARIIKKGTDAAIIATGDMVNLALEAAKTLKKDNINCYVVNIHTIKPIDEVLIKKLSKKCKAIVTIEEHCTIGGLGSAVSSVMSQYPQNRALLKIMGFNDIFIKEYSHDKMKIFEKHGLSLNHLVKEMKKLYSL
jgi:transketolase